MTEPHDDTPAEPSFKFRRLYVFASLAATYLLLGWIVAKTDQPGELKWLAFGLMALHALALAFWAGGASMVDLVMLTKAWRRPDAS